MKVRAFTKQGLEIFSQHIATLRSNQPSELPEDLLSSARTSVDFLPDIEIDETLKIKTYLDLGNHLFESFPDWSWDQCMAKTHDNMWSWVSALYFNQLHQPKGGKTPSLCSNEVWHFIPSDSWNVYYRHKARISLALRQRKDVNQDFVHWLLENSPATGFSTIMEDTVSYFYILKNRGIQDFILDHYRTEDGKVRANTTTKWKNTNPNKAGGNIRRLNVTMKRLDTLADIEEISSHQIGELWGPEYTNSPFKKD